MALHRPEGGLVQDPDLLRSLVAVQGLRATRACSGKCTQRMLGTAKQTAQCETRQMR